MEVDIKKNTNNLWIPIIVGSIFFVLFTFVTIKFIFQAQKANDEQIAEHILKLDNIFKNINNCCKIIGFIYKNAHIDFLTVKDFSGSIVGPLNLSMPDKWQGPYLNNNLTIEGKEYQIVLAKNGYYIIPGDDVVLGNGQIINKTIKFFPDTDIDQMIKDPRYLLSNGKPLAAYIEVAENPEKKQTDDLIVEHLKKFKEIFDNINKTCQITGFRHEKAQINFLNVKSFVGSLIGSMNLLYPQKWAGPYLDINLTINSKFYQILYTKNGYYIIPGDGIQLGNGQIINRTLKINFDSDVETLMRDPKGLSSHDRPLAIKIETIKNQYKLFDKNELFINEPEAY